MVFALCEVLENIAKVVSLDAVLLSNPCQFTGESARLPTESTAQSL